MTTFALDTNIISYLLRNDDRVFAMFHEETAKGNIFIVPPVAYYEIKRGLLAVKATTQLKLFENLCRNLAIGSMGIKEWDEAARIYAGLRQKGELIEDADIFIAAFCLACDYTLVTCNTRHFTRVNALKRVNWQL
jgi:predicted nucleic acid-binding protein